MKNLKNIIIILILFLFYCYFINVVNFPTNIITYSNSLENYKLCPLLKLKGDTFVSSSGNCSNYDLSLALVNIDLKKVELTVMEEAKLVPVR